MISVLMNHCHTTGRYCLKRLHKMIWPMLFVAGLTVTACGGQNTDTIKIQLAELSAENKRLTDELKVTYRTLKELQNAQAGFIAQQVVAQPVRFEGAGNTLQKVIDSKRLRCGGNADLPGFGYLDPDSSEFIGFDIDICRAIGAAILGEQGATQIQILPLTSKLRFASLQAGDIDVLTRNTTWTMSRDTEMRADYAGVTFYDGQGVLVRISDEFRKMSDLVNKAICVQANSTSASNVHEYFDGLGIPVEILEFEDRITALKQYDEGACDAYTADKSSLIAQQTLMSRPGDHVILLEEISREPLGPLVRHGDPNWKDVVTWTIQCLISAESLNISQENVDTFLESESLIIKHLLGVEGKLGRKLGVSDDFCYQIVKQVGNYKDIYDRHLGPDTFFNLPRGVNALYTDGGQHYPLPFK